MESRDIAAVLLEIADHMELAGENPFKVRSFRNGARSIEGLGEDVAARVEAGTLDEVPGIGKALVETISELVRTGRSERLESLRAAMPPGLLEVVRIPGLGPKKARTLHEVLGIGSVAELEAAIEAGELEGVSGFGARTIDKIREGIRYRRSVSGRSLYPLAERVARALVERLARVEGLARVEVAGSVRRRCETVKDVDLIAAASGPAAAEALMESFTTASEVAAVIARGDKKSSVRLADGLQADLRVVEADQFPFALHYFTGSKDHNTALRAIARSRGRKLNEYGLFEVSGDGQERPVACGDEAAIFEALGLAYIEPELRENRGEIELARSDSLPRLVTLDDVRGVVHAHTTDSDGRDTLEDLAEAVRAMGYEYLGVSDHSQSAAYAGGLQLADIERQHEAIDALNGSFDDFRIFKGIESDIRTDGSLDYPEEVLERFDFVIAAVHSGFQLGEAEQTERVVRALRSPYTTFLAHPTGRLLLMRDGYAINMERVLEAAGELGVVVEINANPHRLDLDWRLGPYARRHGVLTAIHPDAHAVDGVADLAYGVGIARKAGFPAEEVVSTLSRDAFAEFIARRRR